jgi:two-component system NtrC family sensor kinase
MKHPENRRVLLVDDMATIHEDFRKILTPMETEQQETLLFSASSTSKAQGFHFSKAVGVARAAELLRQACVTLNRHDQSSDEHHCRHGDS